VAQRCASGGLGNQETEELKETAAIDIVARNLKRFD
jgi:hypothetical protein